MKRKTFNNIMFIISIIYLIGAIISLCNGIIEISLKNFFNTDGLALLGCIFAIGELFLSRKNWISKKINELFILNRLVNYRIGIVFNCKDFDNSIETVVNVFEESIKKTLKIENLNRRPITELKKASWKILYQELPCGIDIYKSSSGVNIKITGNGKYGKIGLRKSNILYFSKLIDSLSKHFFHDNRITTNYVFQMLEFQIDLRYSQLQINNLFNEDMEDVSNYSLNIKPTDDMEMIINKDKILAKTNDVSILQDMFIELTNIICCIE